MENWKTILFILIAMMSGVLGLLYIPNILSGSGLDVSGTAVMTGIGLMGVVMVLVSPVLFLDFWTQGQIAEAVVYSMLLIILGCTFIVAWLWG